MKCINCSAISNKFRNDNRPHITKVTRDRKEQRRMNIYIWIARRAVWLTPIVRTIRKKRDIDSSIFMNIQNMNVIKDLLNGKIT